MFLIFSIPNALLAATQGSVRLNEQQTVVKIWLRQTAILLARWIVQIHILTFTQFDISHTVRVAESGDVILLGHYKMRFLTRLGLLKCRRWPTVSNSSQSIAHSRCSQRCIVSNVKSRTFILSSGRKKVAIKPGLLKRHVRQTWRGTLRVKFLLGTEICGGIAARLPRRKIQ